MSDSEFEFEELYYPKNKLYKLYLLAYEYKDIKYVHFCVSKLKAHILLTRYTNNYDCKKSYNLSNHEYYPFFSYNKRINNGNIQNITIQEINTSKSRQKIYEQKNKMIDIYNERDGVFVFNKKNVDINELINNNEECDANKKFNKINDKEEENGSSIFKYMTSLT